MNFPQQGSAPSVFANGGGGLANGHTGIPIANGGGGLASNGRRPSGLTPEESYQMQQQQQQLQLQAQAQAQAQRQNPGGGNPANPFAGTGLARGPPPPQMGGPQMGMGMSQGPGSQGALALQQQQALLRASAGGGGGSAVHPPSSGPPRPPQHSGSMSLAAPVDGGPPFNVPLLGMFTRMAALPPGVPFPSIPPEDQVRVKGWMAKDAQYERDIVTVKRARKGEFQSMAEDVMRSQDWLGGESGSRTRLKIRLDAERTKERERGKRGNNRKEIKLTKDGVRAIAKLPEILIPVRLEYEHEAYKLRDTFTWNIRETLLTPEVFASHLCEDLRLPHHPFFKEIVAQIKRHIEDAHVTEDYIAHVGDDLAEVREENRAWFESERKRRRVEQEEDDEDENDEVPVTLRELEKQDGKDEELRVLIKLDITLDSFQLVDRFEWDISDPHNSPEEFAEVFVADLGLGGEFRTAVAHSIREQIDVYVKSLCLLGHVTGYPVPDDDLRREFLPPLFEPFRSEVGDFQPVLSQLSPDEIERNDKEREREVRRKRRQTKGRGVTLPDRDPVKTHRTLVPKPSNVQLHSYQDSRGDMVYPMPDMSRPYPIARPNMGDKPPPIKKPAATTAADRANLTEDEVMVRDGLIGAGTGARLRRMRVGDSSHAPSANEVANANSSSETNARATTPQPSEASKSHVGAARNSPAANRVRKPPVIQASLEELGLHEHMIDGQWFCANCGVPDALAVGRRKGLSGHNTLCGTCGKYFHRYRRNRPCEYTTDLSAHQRTKKAAAEAPTASEPKTRKKAKPSTAALPAASTTSQGRAPQPKADNEASDGSDDERPGPSQGEGGRASRESSDDSDGNDSDSSSVASPAAPALARPNRGNSPDLPYVDVASPDSAMSSLSPSPPPQGDYAAAPAPPVPAPRPQAPPPAPVARAAPDPLPWMAHAAADLRSKQADDRFEIIPRGRPADPALQEWRIRCLDCPGKLYNLGPGETLDNFSVHFKNRQHRANVEVRTSGS
ncbi:hypothetical protein RQP46_011443 [Phenoliferia psychrophenolica]